MDSDFDEFFAIPITVRRKLGEGSFGASFADPALEHGRVRYGNRLVRDVKGAEVMSTARATLPLATTHIPVGSLVTVGTRDEREREVIAEEYHDTGMADMPNHYTIDLT